MAPLRVRLTLLLVGLTACLSGPTAAPATDLPVQGGAGGRDFRAECDRSRDQVLVGLSIRQGNFLDAIAPICSDVKGAKETTGAPVVGQAHGGSGGAPKSARCPINMAVATLMFTVTISGETRRPAHVRSLIMRCRDLPGNGAFLRSWYAMFDNERSARPIDDPAQFVGWDNPHGKGTCPEGEIAVGIRGRAGVHVSTEGNVGRFVNALGLICGRLPVPAMGRSRPANVPSFGAEARIGGTVRDATQPPKQAPAPDPPPPGPKAFPLACRGGGGMEVSSSGDVVTIVFRRAAAAASTPPGMGECAWLDRPVSGKEPSMLVLPSGTARRDVAAAAARQGGEFQVQAFNNNQGALVTASVDFAVVMTERPPETQGAPQPGVQLARLIKAANVRLGPNGHVIATVPAGTVVPIERCEASWCQVVLPAVGPVAWIHQSLLAF